MGIVFDTSVVIAYKPQVLPPSTLWSIVVIQELMAGAQDKSEIKMWESAAQGHDKKNRLLVPTTEDWLMAGRVLNSLLRGLKSKREGKIPNLHPDDKQRIIRDVLIARTVRRVNGLLVTGNLHDFKRIKEFCNVRLMSGKEFFG